MGDVSYAVTGDASGYLQSWNAQLDFSGENNPNGAWSAGYATALGGNTTLYTATWKPDNNATFWSHPATDPGGATGSFSQWLFFAKDVSKSWVVLHAGCGSIPYSVLRWTAPSAGEYDVSVQFHVGDFGTTSGSVILNGNTTLFHAASTNESPTFSTTLVLNTGNYLDFPVGPAGDNCFGDSTPITVTVDQKSPQVIAFTSAAPNPGLVGMPYTVSATGGGSGNPVTFSSLTPSICTVASNAVSFVSAGLCSIAANQAGSQQYTAAPQAIQNIVVKSGLAAACGHELTGVAWDGTYYYVAEGQFSLTQCITRFDANATYVDHKPFQIDMRGLHYVPATGKLVTRHYNGPLFAIDYATGTYEQLTSYAPAPEQVQAAADPAGSTFWFVNGSNAEEHRITDNVVLRSFPVETTNPYVIAVSHLSVFTVQGTTVHVYDKATGESRGTLTLPSPLGCYTQWGFGAAATADRLLYVKACDRADVFTTGLSEAAEIPPVANAGGPYWGVAARALSFDGTSSSDADGDALTYSWSFGDGTSTTGASPTHTYAVTGVYPVSLTVTDPSGLSATISTTATVAHSLPLIMAGEDYSCALRADGTGRCWGSSPYSAHNIPTGVTFTQLSGVFATCGLKTAGSIQCWGGDGSGQVLAPAGVFGQLSMGLHHACALALDGLLNCWGSNALHAKDLPAGNYAQVSAGWFTTCAIKPDGSIACAGKGYPSNGGTFAVPGGTFLSVRAGDHHACALKPDRSILCWGANDAGEVGGAPSAGYSTYAHAGTYLDVRAAVSHTCALSTAGAISCWGLNADGRATPPAGSYGQIALSAAHGCALSTDGKITCWGSNSRGQLNVPAEFAPNGPPAVSAGGAYTGIEGSSVALALNGIDPNGDALTYTWDLGDGTTGTGPAPPSSHVYDDNGSYVIQLSATDGFLAATATTQATISNAAPTAAGVSTNSPVDEGASVQISLAGATDVSGADVAAGFQYAFDCGTGYGAFGTTNSASCATTDNGTRLLRATLRDKDGGEREYTASAVINNVAPVLGAITSPLAPQAVTTDVNVSASYTDAGISDTHTVLINWGDGTMYTGTLSGAGGGTVTSSHQYVAAGVYTVTMIVTDDDGAASNTSTSQYVVVYDPNGGFVTGGGWIDSPAGAYTADPLLAGKATFGFVSKYLKGATVPTGNTEFQFQAGSLSFKSSSYEWLVVNQAGTNAQFKGSGTVNGSGSYRFTLWATDGAPDRFRIRIWQENEAGVETVVYDNGTDQQIGGGSIVVHTKR